MDHCGVVMDHRGGGVVYLRTLHHDEDFCRCNNESTHLTLAMLVYLLGKVRSRGISNMMDKV